MWITRDGVPFDAPVLKSPSSSEFRRVTPNVVNFAFNSDMLDAEAQAQIAAQARWILRNPDVQFAITGHTDKVGSEVYNLDLGQRRANAVLEALVDAGVEREQLLAMTSMGEEVPLLDTENRARINRRAVTEVLGDRVLAAVHDDDDGPSIVPDAGPTGPIGLGGPDGTDGFEFPTGGPSLGGPSTVGAPGGDSSGGPVL